MNRRGFFAAVAATALVAAADLTRLGRTLNTLVPPDQRVAETLRDYYRANLAAWHSRELDRLMYNAFTVARG